MVHASLTSGHILKQVRGKCQTNKERTDKLTKCEKEKKLMSLIVGDPKRDVFISGYLWMFLSGCFHKWI